LNTCIANAAEIFYERRQLCERRAEEALAAATQTSYGLTKFGTAEFLHNAKVASDEARLWAQFEVAARGGHLLRMQSGTVGDLVTCDPVLAPVYAAAQKAGRVRTLKSDEAEDVYLTGTPYEFPEEIG